MKPSITTFLFAWLLVGGFLSLPAQALTSAQIARLDSVVTREVGPGTPGLAVGVVRGGKIVYEKYAGLADRKSNTPIGPEHRFNYASVAKQFTALSILFLEAEGRLSLESDFRDYVTDILPDHPEPITVAQLLTHRSGIRDVYNLWALQGIVWWKATRDNADALELLRGQTDLNFAPGSRHMYSNSNYILLSEIVAHVTGKPFKDHSDSLFRALGMADLRFETDHTHIAAMAKPYFAFDNWFGYRWKGEMVGDGALFGTLRDGLKFEVLLQSSTGNALLRKVLDKSQEKVPGMQGDYGFGLEHGTFRSMPYRYHEGSTGAWQSSLVRFPEEELAVVVLSNSGAIYPPNVSRRVAKVVLELPKRSWKKPPLAPEELGKPLPEDDFAGTYATSWGYFFRFRRDGEDLILERAEREDVRLVKENDNLYHEKNDPVFKQHFTFDPERGYEITAYHTSHQPYTLTKQAVDWTGYDPTDIEGKYRNDETESTVKISHREDNRYEVRLGKNKYRSRMLVPDVLLLQGYRLDFFRTDAGNVSKFELFVNRLQKVLFSRRL